MNKRTAEKTKVTPAPSKSSPRKNPATTGRKGDVEEMKKTIWLDPDALSVECVICFMPFEFAMFMCNNGHTACAKCCVRLNCKGWGNEEPIGDVRCCPLEKMLAEMNSVCKFSKYGCVEVIKYIDKHYHEEMCPHTPFGCPLGGCSYRSMLLYRHVLDDHKDATTTITYLQATTVTLHKGQPFRVLLQASMGSVFMLLNSGGVLAGWSLSLVCLGPHPEGNVVTINFKMEVRGSMPGMLSLAGTAPCIRLLEGYETKQFLFVPDTNWGPSSNVSVSNCIC